MSARPLPLAAPAVRPRPQLPPAAAEEAQLTGKQEARQAGEGERAALEADLIQAREQLAQNKESASAQGALIEQARHEAAALVAKSEAAAAAAVAAASVAGSALGSRSTSSWNPT